MRQDSACFRSHLIGFRLLKTLQMSLKSFFGVQDPIKSLQLQLPVAVDDETGENNCGQGQLQGKNEANAQLAACK